MTGEERVTRAIETALERSKEPDPAVVVRRLIPRLTSAQRDELLILGASQLARVVVGRMRMKAAGEKAMPGPSKWRRKERNYIHGEWTFLANCGVTDLLRLANEYRGRAQENIVKADQVEALARELSKSGFSTLDEMWAAGAEAVAA